MLGGVSSTSQSATPTLTATGADRVTVVVALGGAMVTTAPLAQTCWLLPPPLRTSSQSNERVAVAPGQSSPNCSVGTPATTASPSPLSPSPHEAARPTPTRSTPAAPMVAVRRSDVRMEVLPEVTGPLPRRQRKPRRRVRRAGLAGTGVKPGSTAPTPGQFGRCAAG